MNQTSDFDNLNTKSLFDTELTSLFREKPTHQVLFAQSDFLYAQKRERIDSEDFVLPITLSHKKDTDFFVADFHPPKISVNEEPPVRRKSSTAIDSNLLEFEVH